jgi:hypothetical protein
MDNSYSLNCANSPLSFMESAGSLLSVYFVGVMLCIDTMGYQRFGEPCCFQLQDEMALTLVALRSTPSVNPSGQGIEPCVGS